MASRAAPAPPPAPVKEAEGSSGEDGGVAALRAEVEEFDRQLEDPKIRAMEKVAIKKKRQMKNAERIRLERKLRGT